jgi:hypothetical protein
VNNKLGDAIVKQKKNAFSIMITSSLIFPVRKPLYFKIASGILFDGLTQLIIHNFSRTCSKCSLISPSIRIFDVELYILVFEILMSQILAKTITKMA